MENEDKITQVDSIELPFNEEPNNFEELPKELKLKLAAVESDVEEINWQKGLLKGFLACLPFLALSILFTFTLKENLTLLVKFSFLVTVLIFLITGTLTAFKSLRKRK